MNDQRVNDQLFEAIERMTEKGYSAEMIRRAAQILKEKYIIKEERKNENK